MVEWNGSTAFITGGAQGIGLGIARALARKGVRLALADIDGGALQAAGAELADVTRTETFELDVRDRDAFATVADEVESSLGPVSLLFNNAGVAPIVSTSRMTFEDWDWSLDINLFGVINGVQTFVPRMIARGHGGYVVNTASGAGLVAAGGPFYATAKFAVVGLSESLAADLSEHGINVSVLCPGPVDTQIIRNTLEHQNSDGATASTLAAAEAAREFLSTGVSIDSVGDRVVAAMESGQMWIHTDEDMRTYIEMRLDALLASFPAVIA